MELAEHAPSMERNAEELLSSRADLTTLHRALDRLPEKYRRVLVSSVRCLAPSLLTPLGEPGQL